MRNNMFGVLATLLISAAIVQADVLVDYSGGSATSASNGVFTYTFSDLSSDPVTMTPGTAGSGALDAARDALSYSPVGTFTLSVMGYLSMDTATWTPGTVDALTFKFSGLSVAAANGAIRKGEALLYTVSIDSTLQTYLDSNGYSLRLTEFAAGIMDSGATLSFHTQAGGATAVATATDLTPVSVSTVLTDGMQFAFINPATGTPDTSLTSIAVDIVPEPATLGMIAFAGTALMVIRRRFIR
jgi:hypothetical protein